MDGSENIFIVSQPRAGSTLLQALLSNNSYVNTVSESWMLLGLAPLLKSSLVLAKYDYNITMDAINQFELSNDEFELFEAVKNIADNFYKILLDGGYRYVLDKTPRYYEILELIGDLYPKSKIIILKRNPIDTALSLIKKRNITKVSDLFWNNRDLLVAPYLIQDFLDKKKGDDNVISIHYENLIESPQQQIHRVYDKLNIPFTKEVLQIDANKKIHGKYGDANIQTPDFSKIIRKTIEPELNKEMAQFISGYSHFLGGEFLQKYGTYKVSSWGSKPTKQFDGYLKEVSIQNNNLDRSVYNKFKNCD